MWHPDYEKRIARLRRAAERGDARRACELVTDMLDIPRSKRALDEARRWAPVAIEHPDPDEAVYVAGLFIWGDKVGGARRPRAVGRDPQFGIKLLRSMVRRGVASAAFHLSWIEWLGVGVPRSAAGAEHWARVASELGDSDWINDLGVMFDTARGAARDCKRAVRCYRVAARSGHVLATANLAHSYRDGEGVARNPRRFVELARRAARRGNAMSRVSLASARIEGRGLARDRARGLRELRALAREGVEGALETLDEFEPKRGRVGASAST